MKYVYHGTTIQRAKQISIIGLLPGKVAGNTISPNIYLSDSEHYAKTYADRKGGARGIILRIKKLASIVPDPGTWTKGDYKTSRKISPKNIEFKYGDKWVAINKIGELQ